MRYFLSTLLLVSLSSTSHASDKTYDWVLKQYATNNTSEISAHTDGRIHDTPYIAIIANRTSPTQEYDPTIIFFRKTKGALSTIAKIDLHGDYANNYNVIIENNSIYLEQWTVHHGLFGIRYQFKKINKKFEMIGAESQSQISGCYADDESNSCGKYDFWSGTSYNFLTSSSICWQKTINSRNEKESKKSLRKLKMFLRPSSGVSHKMKFPPINPQPLNGFDLLNSFLPNTCYFDVKNKLQFITARHQ